MLKKEDYIIIDCEKWVNYKWIKNNLNIKRDRLDKWLKGRGQAILRPLRFIKVGPQYSLYNLNDILELKNLTEEYLKIYPLGGYRVKK